MAKPPENKDKDGGEGFVPEAREVIIESIKIGNAQRIAAVDATTGTEVTFQAPLGASRAMIQRIAMDKLNYVMKKAKE